MNHTLVRSHPIRAVALGLPLAAPTLSQVPTPQSDIGWGPGTDYKLADYGQLRQLDPVSDRLMLTEIGTTAEERPMMLAIISGEENMRQLDRWKDIAHRMAMVVGSTEDEVRMYHVMILPAQAVVTRPDPRTNNSGVITQFL